MALETNKAFARSASGICMIFAVLFSVIAFGLIETTWNKYFAGTQEVHVNGVSFTATNAARVKDTWMVFHEFSTCASFVITFILYLLTVFNVYRSCFQTGVFKTLLVVSAAIWTVLLIASSAYIASLGTPTNEPLGSIICGFLAALFHAIHGFTVFKDIQGTGPTVPT